MSKYAVDELTALTTDSDITIKGRGTGKVSLGDGELLFPDADGTANQVIKTDGSGTLSFVSAASSDPGGSNTHVQYNSSGAFAGSSNLTFDGSKFTVAGSITAGGSAAGNVLTLTSTDAGSASGPDIELFRDSASAANNDQLGNIRFYGRDSASNKQLYAKIEGKSGSVTSGSERGILEFLTAHTDTGALTSSMSLGGNATVFNANFKDIDFRVKGTIHSHLFVVDALSNKVGISAIGGQNPAASLLHIQSPDAGTIVTIETTNTGSASGPDLELYRNSATPATSDALGKIAFYGEEATSSDKIAYASIEASIDDATNTAYEGQLNFQIASSGALASFLLLHNRAGSEPEVVVNEDSNNMDFRVESNAQTHMLFVDAGSSFVSIGSSISTKVTGATGLQIVDGDLGLMVGADVGAKTLTDATQKKGRIAMPHYDNAEEALCLIGSDANGSTSAVNIGGSVNTLNAATVVKFYTAANDTTLKGTEAMRIDNSQRVLIGHTSNLGVLSINHSLQVNGTGENDAGMSFGNWSATAQGCRLTFHKSRHASIGGNAIVSSGDTIANISFSGNDGAGTAVSAASIIAQVDGTPGANDMPGRLVFSTTADGASSPTEALRIDSTGRTTAFGPMAIQDGSTKSLQVGADFNGTTLTDATPKGGYISTPHYTNSEEPLGLIFGNVQNGYSHVNIGGGSGSFNAASTVKIWAAQGNTTTTTGNLIVNIDGWGVNIDGVLTVKSNNLDYLLHVDMYQDNVQIGGDSNLTPTGHHALYIASGAVGLIVGADNTHALTNATTKTGRIGAPHATNSEEPSAGLIMMNDSSHNTVAIGGGSSLMNAATQLKFYTAAGNVTTTGTVALTIDGSQNATFAGDVSVGGNLDLGDSSNYLKEHSTNDWGVVGAHWHAQYGIWISGDGARNNGFQLSAGNVGLDFKANGDIALTLDNNQNATFAGNIKTSSDTNIGIGVTASMPVNTHGLHIKSTADGGAVLIQGASDSQSEIRFTDGANRAQIVCSINDNLSLRTGSGLTEALNLDSSQNATFSGTIKVEELNQGRILFNQTGAAANNRLWDVVAEGEKFSMRTINDGNSAAGTWLEVQRTLNAVDSIAFSTGSATVALTIDSSQNATFTGNVGIGTPAPVNLLHISNSSTQSDTYGNLHINYTGSTTGINSGLTVKNYSGTSQFMQWDTYGLRLGSRIITNGGTGDVLFTQGADSIKMWLTSFGLVANDGIGWAAVNEASSATNPTLIPDRSELGSGLGGTSNGLSLITLGVEALKIDSSQNATFAGHIKLSGQRQIYTTASNNLISISGGNSADSGANILLYGQSHSSRAKDFDFRSSTTSALYYDDSASSWDFQANAITTTGTLAAGTLTVANGSYSAPSIAFAGDTDTGFYWNWSGKIGVTLNGDITAIFIDPGIRVLSGSESGPSFAFIDDQDTGIFNPSSNKLGFSVGGVEKMHLDSSGNLGIGTTAPYTTSKLQASGATSTTVTAYNATSPPAAGQIDIHSTDAYTTQRGGKLTFSGVSGASPSAVVQSVYGAIQGVKTNATLNHAGGGLILSTTVNSTGVLTERMRILGEGNVGIGTPDPDTKLHVFESSGTTPATTGTTISGSAVIQGQNTALAFGGESSLGNMWMQAANINDLSATRSIIINPNGGKVGIGMAVDAVPSNLLQVGPVNSTETISVKAASGGANIIMRAVEGTLGTFGSTNNVPVNFIVSNDEKMRIKVDGNVGIGTSDPATKLHVTGGGIVVATIEGSTRADLILIDSGAGTDLKRTVIRSIDGKISFTGENDDIDAARTSMTINAGYGENGNVGIGTSDPASTLTVAGTINITTAAGTYAAGVLGYTDANWGFIFRPPRAGGTAAHLFESYAGVDLVAITEAGNVGIGTSTIATNFRQEIVGIAGSGAGPASSGTTQIASAVMRIRSGGGFTGTLDIGQAGGTGGWIQSTDTGNLATTYPLMLNPVGGNVGIGTASPITKLDITGSGAYSNRIIHIAGDINPTGYDAGTSGARIAFTYGTAEVGGIRSGVTDGTGGSETGRLVFSTANSGTLSEKMRIEANGNVSIGTTSSGAKLRVHSSNIPTNTSYLPAILTGGSYGGGLATIDTTYSGWYQISNGTNWHFYHNRAANVTASSKIVLSFSATEAIFNETARNLDLRVESSGNSNMLFVDGGNNRVGIGTASPTQSLDVYGTGHISQLQGGNQNGSGNFHIDSKNASPSTGAIYLNWYGGTGGVVVGNGSSAYGNLRAANITIGTSTPFSKLQVGSHTFTGANGMYNNGRVGISNHGNLTGLMLASTYNNATHPEYGLVFVTGPSTSSYNVWSISPDGPARGDSLNFIYGAQSSNIHNVVPKVIFDGNGNVGIGIAPSARLHIKQPGNSTQDGIRVERSDTTAHGVIYMGGDDNLYIQNQANGGINWYTDADLKMTLKADGKLGIGIAPTARLHIKQATQNIAGGLRIERSDTTGHTGMHQGADSNFYIRNTENGGIIFKAGSDSEKMRIDANGKVTITEPLTITAVGTFASGVELKGYGGTDNYVVQNNSGKFRVYNSTDSRTDFEIDGVGHVGIGGAANVTSDLIVDGGASTTARLFVWETAGNNYTEIFSNGTEGRLQTRGAHPLTLGTANQERMRITSSGNVGIGTSPASKLHILGGSHNTISRANANLTVEGAGGNGLVIGTMAASTYASYIQAGFVPNFATAVYPLLLNPSGGNVGIGTSPSYKLHVKTTGTGTDGIFVESTTGGWAHLRAKMSAGANNGIVQSNDSGIIFSGGSENSGNFVIAPWASATGGLRITSAGYVGIGTSAAPAALTVDTTKAGSNGNWYDPANYAGFIRHNANATQRYGLLVANRWRNSENFVFAVDGTYTVDGTIANDTHTPYFIVRGDGNVGIGTASPGSKLDVNGTITCTATATLLVKNSSGATLKTINGVST